MGLRWTGKEWAFCCMGWYFYRPRSDFFLSNVWACFHFGACVVPQINEVLGIWEMFVLRVWEGLRVCWQGEGGGEIELFVGLFWAPLPLLQMSICSPPSSKCWGCRWPTEEKHLLISPWPSNYLPIYSSAHLMTIHLIHSTILLPLLHPSNNQSINTSICAPIQQFIYPSMNLLIIHPFIYHLSIHPS